VVVSTTEKGTSIGKSALWSEDGQVVAADTGTGELLVVGKKDKGIWKDIVLSL
jgi:hypothetical protein